MRFHHVAVERWLEIDALTFVDHEVGVRVADDGSTVDVTVGDQTITGVEKVTVDAHMSDPDAAFDPSVMVGAMPDHFTVTVTLRVKHGFPVGVVQVPAPKAEAETVDG